MMSTGLSYTDAIYAMLVVIYNIMIYVYIDSTNDDMSIHNVSIGQYWYTIYIHTRMSTDV